MKHKGFDLIGVELYDNGEKFGTRYFDTMKEAIEFARDRGSAGYSYKFITANEYGNKIEEL